MSSTANTKQTPWLSLMGLPLVGLLIILVGAWLAHSVRTSGDIAVQDIRFTGADGTQMSALLYVPKNASAESPAPGILAVHGYINSREMQDGFSIEFARRGYVVLAMDQTGHGYSGGAAFANGFGGPDGLAYLRSLPMVDPTQIGLEGHSMGGWTVLAAAATMPDSYTSMVLVGSSTGAPFAQEGSPTWPRNLSLIFSKYDEFGPFMWGMERSIDLPTSDKLKAVFDSEEMIEPARLYGGLEQGTARVLHHPDTTHPGEHLSTEVIGLSADWFGKTLKGGTPLNADDQIWYWKELGTGVGLIGFVMLVLGLFNALLNTPLFTALKSASRSESETQSARESRDSSYWRAFMASAFVPAVLFFPAFVAITLLVAPSSWLPQTVTTQVAFWALLSAGFSLLMWRFSKSAPQLVASSWGLSIASAVITVALAYGVLFIIDSVWNVDLRFWVVAVKLPSAAQLGVALIYVLPITLAFTVTMRGLCGLTVKGDTPAQQYGYAIGALSLGFLSMLVLVYGIFFATGTLVTGFDPLSTVIGLQFVPLLIAIAIIGIYGWRRTGSHRPSAVIVGLLVTLYVVAGTATQVV